VPQVFAISYGSAISTTCHAGAAIWAQANCGGLNAQSYLEKVNQNLQALALMGISVVVASGDNGAPHYGAATGQDHGFCPVDLP